MLSRGRSARPRQLRVGSRPSRICRTALHHDRRAEPDGSADGQPDRRAPSRIGCAPASSSASFFDMLGVQPIIGRAFAAGEDGPARRRRPCSRIATWQQRFGGDPAILGRPLDAEQRAARSDRRHAACASSFPIDDLDVWMPSCLVSRSGSASAAQSQFDRRRRACRRASRSIRRQPSCGRWRATGACATPTPTPTGRFASSRSTRSASALVGRNLKLLIGRGRLRAADRLRQYRQPAARARVAARQREMAVRARSRRVAHAARDRSCCSRA